MGEPQLPLPRLVSAAGISTTSQAAIYADEVQRFRELSGSNSAVDAVCSLRLRVRTRGSGLPGWVGVLIRCFRGPARHDRGSVV
jgi:hypothetical protein